MGLLYNRYMDTYQKGLLEAHGIDPAAVEETFSRYERQQQVTSASFKGFPEVDGKHVLSAADLEGISVSFQDFQECVREYIPGLDPRKLCTSVQKDQVYLDREALETLGILLYPYAAYGILNGGSATSYIDGKKNRSYGEELFSLCSPHLETLNPLCEGTPKGLTPGFLHPSGEPGPAFLELKMRHLLLTNLRYRRLKEDRFASLDIPDCADIPLFQMTSAATHSQILQAMEEYQGGPLLAQLQDLLGSKLTCIPPVQQPMLAACNPPQSGEKLSIFTQAWGRDDTPLALPGGHGQNFSVLKETYRQLENSGRRFAWVGNIDNLGNTLNPVHLALTALKGTQGSFEFSFKTPVDLKGGILVINDRDHLDCMDIGAAISPDDVSHAESQGTHILFNCATGLFNLTYLASRIDDITNALPLRLSTQDKDAGRYSQLEQITWEVIGILPEPMVLAVAKEQRFLAAKLAIEMVLTSLAPQVIRQREAQESDDFGTCMLKLNQGLKHVLACDYGLVCDGGSNQWMPDGEDR